MIGLAITIPSKKVSAWITETDPRNARAWLASLPYADSAEAGRELFQALYTLNRMELEPPQRFELMELYRAPVASVCKSLQSHFAHAAFPLSPSRHQLAQFLRQLHQEMAYGYKCCLWDQHKAFFPWGKKSFLATVAERAMHYLGETLLRSYRVYMPYPAGTWKEIHELYRYAEEINKHQSPVATGETVSERSMSVAQRYLQIALIGAVGPYQLPQDGCLQVAAFLENWVDKARILHEYDAANPHGQFLIDLSSDSPPVPFPKNGPTKAGGQLRVLNAVELVRTVHSFVTRLQRGESSRSMNLGFEYLDASSLDILQRMMRAWGLVVRRRHSRIKRNTYVFLCVGLNAAHFFANGQKPFELPAATEGATAPPPAEPPRTDSPGPEAQASDEAYVALEELEGTTKAAEKPASAFSTAGRVELYRVDRWRVRDLGPQGMALASEAGGTHLRVGDLTALQQVNEMGKWSLAVVRWLKMRDTENVHIGIEFLGADVKPAAVRRLDPTSAAKVIFEPALLVPAIERVQQPASLIVARGGYRAGADIELIVEDGPARRARLVQQNERSGAFEQFVFVELLRE